MLGSIFPLLVFGFDITGASIVFKCKQLKISHDEKQNHNHYTGSGYIKTKSGNMLPCIDILK